MPHCALVGFGLISQISPVTLSVTVPSPLFLYDVGLGSAAAAGLGIMNPPHWHCAFPELPTGIPVHMSSFPNSQRSVVFGRMLQALQFAPSTQTSIPMPQEPISPSSAQERVVPFGHSHTPVLLQIIRCGHPPQHSVLGMQLPLQDFWPSQHWPAEIHTPLPQDLG